jgi:hypothetical protein
LFLTLFFHSSAVCGFLFLFSIVHVFATCLQRYRCRLARWMLLVCFFLILLERFTIMVSLFLMTSDFTARETNQSAHFIIHSVSTSDDFLYHFALSIFYVTCSFYLCDFFFCTCCFEFLSCVSSSCIALTRFALCLGPPFPPQGTRSFHSTDSVCSSYICISLLCFPHVKHTSSNSSTSPSCFSNDLLTLYFFSALIDFASTIKVKPHCLLPFHHFWRS